MNFKDVLEMQQAYNELEIAATKFMALVNEQSFAYDPTFQIIRDAWEICAQLDGIISKEDEVIK